MANRQLSSLNTTSNYKNCCTLEVAYVWKWAIPENIRTPWRTAFWNSEGKGGFFELEFQGQGGFLWTGILKAWGGTYIWNSEGLKLLILWTLPVHKWSTTERRNTDDDHESAGYRRSIDRSRMCWRKPIKLGLHIKFMNFLTMNIRLIKYEQIFVRVCTVKFSSAGRRKLAPVPCFFS